MSFNYPDFLPASSESSDPTQKFNPPPPPAPPPGSSASQPSGPNANPPNPPLHSQPPGSEERQFNSLLFNKLSSLESYHPENDSLSSKSPTSGPMNDFLLSSSFYGPKDSFNLPLELQGGIGNISSRRPSYAAESFTRSNFPPLLNNNSQLSSEINPQLPQGNSGGSSFFGGKPNTASSNNPHKNLSSYAMLNNYNQNFNLDQLNDNFGNFNLNSNFNDFQARRPSQLADFQQPQFTSHLQNQFAPPPLSIGENQSFAPFNQQLHQPKNQQNQNQQQQQQPQHQQQQQFHPGPQQKHLQSQQHHQLPQQFQGGNIHGQQIQQQQIPQGNVPFNQSIKLENGLILKDQYIIASPDLKALYSKTTKYFQDPELTNQILSQLHSLLSDPIIVKLITFIKNLNNLTFNHKILCLVINKNGKFDLLSYPNNSNIFLQRDDLVIVDGDRGKDSVMIVEPLVNLNFAILFNFLKKLEHLKSLTIDDGHHQHNNHQKTNGTHSTLLNASTIINSHSNEDNEFIITLPTKQVLRFATPKEIHKISGKFLEEKKAFITCYNKIKELNLEKDLTLINVEYQSDFKKLIFYYFANFKRIDFRGLIKELFKIYKTRIWLCAVLPYDKPELYIKVKEDGKNKKKEDEGNTEPKAPSGQEFQSSSNQGNSIPKEYELSNEQILNFSINEFDHLSNPNYFHSINLLNLIKFLSNEIGGNFYGFNTGGTSSTRAQSQGSNTAANASSPAAGSDRSKILPSFNPFGDLN